jgi:hypothetical protein
MTNTVDCESGELFLIFFPPSFEPRISINMSEVSAVSLSLVDIFFFNGSIASTMIDIPCPDLSVPLLVTLGLKKEVNWSVLPAMHRIPNMHLLCCRSAYRGYPEATIRYVVSLSLVTKTPLLNTFFSAVVLLDELEKAHKVS